MSHAGLVNRPEQGPAIRAVMMFQTKILSIKNLVKMIYAPSYQIGPAGVAAAEHVDPVNRPDQEDVIRAVMTSIIPVSDKHKAAMFAIVVSFEH